MFIVFPILGNSVNSGLPISQTSHNIKPKALCLNLHAILFAKNSQFLKPIFVFFLQFILTVFI